MKICTKLFFSLLVVFAVGLPTLLPTKAFAEVIISSPYGSGSNSFGYSEAHLQQLGNGWSGYAKILKFTLKHGGTNRTVRFRIDCFTNSGYTSTCANSDWTDTKTVTSSSYAQYTFTLPTYYALSASNYYVITGNPSNTSDLFIQMAGSGDVFRCSSGAYGCDLLNPKNQYVTVSNGADITSFTVESSSVTLSISNFTASASAGFSVGDYSGDTGYTSSNEKCTIDLFQVPTGQNSPGLQSPVPFATILLDASKPLTMSSQINENTYLGAGFTSTVSTWTALDVYAPFFADASMQVAQVVYCTHDTTNADGSVTTTVDVNKQGLSWLESNWSPLLISTPSALQRATDSANFNYLTECTSTGLFAWVCDFKVWLYKSLTGIFGINGNYATSKYIAINNVMATKVPFAYWTTAKNLNFSPSNSTVTFPRPTLSSNEATLTLPMFINNASQSGTPYKFIVSGLTTVSLNIQQYLWPIGDLTKPIIAVGLWIIFLDVVIISTKVIFK